MQFSIKSSLNSSIKSSVIILKLVVPIYIISDILFHYNLLQYVTFLFEPITSIISLPPETAISIVSGMFLNLYAAIAFAAPLDLTPKEWTILAIFLGICHSLVVETAVMKKLGISKIFSIMLRVIAGLMAGFATTLLPDRLFKANFIQKTTQETAKHFDSFFDLIINSLSNAIYLSIQIIILITTLIFILDYIKSLKFIQKYSEKVNSAFSIGIGVVLGITYGAGILINEYEKETLSKNEILFIGTFLMICHAIIEDTLLFAIFGANIWIIVSMRLIFAIIISYLIIKVYSKLITKNSLHVKI